jgi:hypothetical protein
MSNVTICRIRPMSWKICVQGEGEAEYVRGVLTGAKLESTECRVEMDLAEPPVYSFVAYSKEELTITAAELESILGSDERIQLNFDSTA